MALLLPQVYYGECVLTKKDWLRLEEWVNGNWNEVNLSITSAVRNFIKCPFLFMSEDENDYAHISGDCYLRKCSYMTEGIVLYGRTISEALHELKQNGNS